MGIRLPQFSMEIKRYKMKKGHTCYNEFNSRITSLWSILFILFIEFFLTIVGLCIGSAIVGMAYGRYIYNRTKNLPDGHPHKPRKINNLWEDDDIRDILKV